MSKELTIETIFKEADRKLCREAILSCWYYFRKNPERTKWRNKLGIKNSNLKNHLSDVKRKIEAIKQQLKQCKTLDEEINYLVSTINEWRKYISENEYIEKSWEKVETSFVEEFEIDLKKVKDKDTFSEDKYKDKLIDEFMTRVEEHYEYMKYGTLYCRRVRLGLTKELLERQKRSGDSKIKAIKPFDVNLGLDRIQWISPVDSKSNKGVKELVYLISRLIDLGYLNYKKDTSVNKLIHNFFADANDLCTPTSFSTESISSIKTGLFIDFDQPGSESVTRYSNLLLLDINKGLLKDLDKKVTNKKSNINQIFETMITEYLKKQ